jgi:hypothetical protein
VTGTADDGVRLMAPELFTLRLAPFAFAAETAPDATTALPVRQAAGSSRPALPRLLTAWSLPCCTASVATIRVTFCAKPRLIGPLLFCVSAVRVTAGRRHSVHCRKNTLQRLQLTVHVLTTFGH